MTRREGIIAALAMIGGLMSDRAKADGNLWTKTYDSSGHLTSITMPKSSITLPLDSYTEFHFTCGQDSVTLTPAEIMAALQEK